jgi:hypothetical protein
MVWQLRFYRYSRNDSYFHFLQRIDCSLELPRQIKHVLFVVLSKCASPDLAGKDETHNCTSIRNSVSTQCDRQIASSEFLCQKPRKDQFCHHEFAFRRVSKDETHNCTSIRNSVSTQCDRQIASSEFLCQKPRNDKFCHPEFAFRRVSKDETNNCTSIRNSVSTQCDRQIASSKFLCQKPRNDKFCHPEFAFRRVSKDETHNRTSIRPAPIFKEIFWRIENRRGTTQCDRFYLKHNNIGNSAND